MPHRALMGMETEYALAGDDSRGVPVGQAVLADALLEEARRAQPTLPDGGHGVFLPNGARFYIDCGSHPEYATPECADPWELVTQLRAGELQLRQLMDRLTRRGREYGRMELFRSNVDYAGKGVTWGCHESYLHRCHPMVLPAQLIPHLVSRIVYAGAGGFNPIGAGLEFTLSPRAWLLADVIAGDSTRVRPLFHTRNEPLADHGYSRLHVICGESLCSDEATLLKVGVTALVVAAIDAGRLPGGDLRLADPLAALRTIAADPACRATVRLASGRSITALEIQRRYLDAIEQSWREGLLPPWAGRLCARWRAMLDQLERDPAEVARTLDWAIKRALYARWLPPEFGWDTLLVYSEAARWIRRALDAQRQGGEESATRPGLGRRRLREEFRALSRWLQSRGLSWEGYRRFRRLRAQLLEADLRFGQLGERGVFTQLDARGVLDHRTADPRAVERAVDQPPGSGRARVRGEWVRRLGRQQPFRMWQATWNCIYDYASDRHLDLSDPFSERARWNRSVG